MSETIEGKTHRLCIALFGKKHTECMDIVDHIALQKLVSIAQAEALEEAAKLQSFHMTIDGDRVVLSEDLLNMARDLRESVK